MKPRSRLNRLFNTPLLLATIIGTRRGRLWPSCALPLGRSPIPAIAYLLGVFLRRMLFTLLRVQVVETHVTTHLPARGALAGVLRRTARLQLSGCASTLPCATPRVVGTPQWECSGWQALQPVAAAPEDRGDAKRPSSQSPPPSASAKFTSRCALWSMCTGRARGVPRFGVGRG
jgi:hypothetical protein